MFDKLICNKKVNCILCLLVQIFLLFFSKPRKRVMGFLNGYPKLKKYEEIEKLAQEKYKNDYVFFSRNGIGDIYFAASLMKEFKKQHPDGRIIYLTEKKSIEKFLKYFDGIDEIIYNKEFQFQHFSPIQKPVQKGRINFLYFPYRGSKKNYVFADSYNNLLNLPLDTERFIPEITDENRQKADEKYKKLGINPDKTIILIQDSVMFDYRILKPEFWVKLAQELKSKGYDVIFNAKKDFKGFKSTFLNIMDFVEFAKKAKHIISFRSGINDLFAAMNIDNMSVIYPYNMEVIWADKFFFDNLLNKYHEKLFDNEIDNIFHIYSLKSNFKDCKADEIFYNCDDNKIIDNIIDCINKTSGIRKRG